MSIFTCETINATHEFLANGKRWWIASTDAGYLAGMVSVETVGDEWAWINDLFVVEPYRRQGVAKLLLSVLEDFASRDSSLVGVACAINRGNGPSCNLFRSRSYAHCYTYPESGTRMYSRRFERSH